jgi:integrase
MATLTERIGKGGKKHYRVQYRLVGQKSFCKTFATEKEAKQFITVTDAKLIQDKHTALLGIKATLFSQVIERYVDQVQIGKEKETVRTEKAILEYWKGNLGHLKCTAITAQHISAFIRELMAEKALSTARRYCVILNRVMNFAVRLEYIAKSPMVDMSKPPMPHGREVYLKQGEIERLLRVCEQDRNKHIYAMVVLALNTGCRLGELQKLRWKDIHGGVITFPIRKQRKPHIVPMTPFLIQTLQEYAEDQTQGHGEMLADSSALVFSNPIGTAINIDRTWKRVRKKAQLQHMHFHVFRHTTACLLLQQGYSFKMVA